MEAWSPTWARAEGTHRESRLVSDEDQAEGHRQRETFTPKIGYPDKCARRSGLAQTATASSATCWPPKRSTTNGPGQDRKPVDRTEWGMSRRRSMPITPAAERDRVPGRDPAPPFFDATPMMRSNTVASAATIGHEMPARLRRPGFALGPTGTRELVDRGGRQGLLGADRQAGEAVQRLRHSPRRAHQRHNHPGREHADLAADVAYDALLKANQGKTDPKTDGLTRDQRFFSATRFSWRGNTRRVVEGEVLPTAFAVAVPRQMVALENLSTFAARSRARPAI